MDLEKLYDRVNKEALWQVLRMYEVGNKLLNGVKSMYVNDSYQISCRYNAGLVSCRLIFVGGAPLLFYPLFCNNFYFPYATFVSTLLFHFLLSTYLTVP